MKYSRVILDYWKRVKSETDISGDFADAWGFGDNPELMDELLGYVLQGVKRSSTSLLKESELQGYPVDKVGDYNIILNGRDEPVAVIKTVSVRRVKYSFVRSIWLHRCIQAHSFHILCTWRSQYTWA